jgi:hypothetical protein
VCEKLNVTRGELDAFVTKKAEEVKAWRAAQEARAAGTTNEQPSTPTAQEADIVVANG